jgi:hypothetical protein
MGLSLPLVGEFPSLAQVSVSWRHLMALEPTT